MKTPPPQDQIVKQPEIVQTGRDRRFLLFMGIVLVALALGFKSELVNGSQAWGLGAGLVVLALPALVVYLRSEVGMPPLEHFVPVAIGAMAVAGLSLFVPEWWKYTAISLCFGIGFFLAGRLDYNRLRDREKPGHLLIQEIVMVVLVGAIYLVLLAVPLPLALRLTWIFAVTFAASYRSFRLLGSGMPYRKALLFAAFVAQVLTFFAWAGSVYLPLQEGVFAALLLFVWYVNQGIIRHTHEESLNRGVMIEYALFAVLAAWLFFTTSQPPR